MGVRGDKFLADFLNVHRETTNDTEEAFGEEAFEFIELCQDAWSIHSAILRGYSLDEQLGSLLFAQLQPVITAIYGMQLDFLLGRYAEVGRTLRFVWELAFRSYHADTYSERFPESKGGPCQSLDDKVAWLDTQQLNRGTVLRQLLRRLFPNWSEEEVERQFGPLWDRLCEVVHPSTDWMRSGVGESCRATFNHFDGRLAGQVIRDASEVCALVFAATAERFPRIIPELSANPVLFRQCPQFRVMLPTRDADSGSG